MNIDQLKHQLEEKDKDLDLTTKTANELIEIKHKLEKQLEEKDKEIADLEKENGILTNLLATKPSEIELDELYTQLKQLKEKDKEIKEKDEQIKKRVMVYEKQFIEQTDEIYSLKQQLVEKQNKIDEISKEFVQVVHAIYDWRVLCAEKDKEIETMKKDSDKNIDYLVEFASLIENEKDCNRMLKALDRVKSGNKYIIDKANQSKTEFAIQELEKVKMLTEWKFESIVDVVNQIDQQIKELKGD